MYFYIFLNSFNENFFCGSSNRNLPWAKLMLIKKQAYRSANINSFAAIG